MPQIITVFCVKRLYFSCAFFSVGLFGLLLFNHFLNHIAYYVWLPAQRKRTRHKSLKTQECLPAKQKQFWNCLIHIDISSVDYGLSHSLLMHAKFEWFMFKLASTQRVIVFFLCVGSSGITSVLCSSSEMKCLFHQYLFTSCAFFIFIIVAEFFLHHYSTFLLFAWQNC